MSDIDQVLGTLRQIEAGESPIPHLPLCAHAPHDSAAAAIEQLTSGVHSRGALTGAIWDGPQDLILAVMVAHGHNPKSISAAIPGRTIVSVKRRARKLNLTFQRTKRAAARPKVPYVPTRIPFKPTDEDEALVRKMAQENKTTDQIKVALGIGYCTLMRYIKRLNDSAEGPGLKIRVNRRYGFSEPLPDWTEAEDDRIWKMKSDGLTIEQISAALSRSRATVEDRLRFLRTGKKRRGPLRAGSSKPSPPGGRSRPSNPSKKRCAQVVSPPAQSR